MPAVLFSIYFLHEWERCSDIISVPVDLIALSSLDSNAGFVHKVARSYEVYFFVLFFPPPPCNRHALCTHRRYKLGIISACTTYLTRDRCGWCNGFAPFRSFSVFENRVVEAEDDIREFPPPPPPPSFLSVQLHPPGQLQQPPDHPITATASTPASPPSPPTTGRSIQHSCCTTWSLPRKNAGAGMGEGKGGECTDSFPHQHTTPPRGEREREREKGGFNVLRSWKEKKVLFDGGPGRQRQEYVEQSRQQQERRRRNDAIPLLYYLLQRTARVSQLHIIASLFSFLSLLLPPPFPLPSPQPV